MVDEPLSKKNRICLEKDVLGRYFFLATEYKNASKRTSKLQEELCALWEKMNFPTIGKYSIIRKISLLIMRRKNNIKNGCQTSFNNVFDITNARGTWLSEEDRRFYNLQLKGKGKIGYCTNNLVNVHPSKRPRKTYTACDCSDSETEEAISEEDVSSEYFPSPTKRKKPCSTRNAVNLVLKCNLSTSKASGVCRIVAENNENISTPSQSGIYKAMIRQSEEFTKTIKNLVSNNSWALHFDGKRTEHEMQVIVLKNDKHEVRLAALTLNDGKATTIVNGIVKVLDFYFAWPQIQMIICDTTAVNTGAVNGVVVQLQERFEEKCLPKPQYIGCEQHILDLILRHVMNELLEESKTSPSISYTVLNEVVNNYESLVDNFQQGSSSINIEKIEWRDDMRFLYELSTAYRHFKLNAGLFPRIKFRKLPNLSNARWNSRAILALLGFILTPGHRPLLRKVCDFITGFWQDAWFSSHYYDDEIF